MIELITLKMRSHKTPMKISMKISMKIIGDGSKGSLTAAE